MTDRVYDQSNGRLAPKTYTTAIRVRAWRRLRLCLCCAVLQDKGFQLR